MGNEKKILDLDETNELEEKKPVVTHRNPDRRKSKEREVTHVLSTQMLPPITKRKSAVYQVINAYKKDPLLAGNATGDDILPFDIVIPGMYTIYDPFEADMGARTKIVKNGVRPGIELRNGQEIQTVVVDDIIMPKGILEVNQETQFLLYVLMELHPLNGSNKRRNRSITPVFERIDMKFKSVASMDAVEDLKEDASRVIKEMRVEDVIGMAATLNIATIGVRTDELRYNLRMFAKANPIEFFKHNPNSEQMVRINFMDAIDLGFVEYVADKKGFRFSNQDKAFFNHAVGEEPVEATVKYLASSNGVTDYNLITEYLGFWDK